jgi:predicted enzyme related to lactoylglutathione lyase
MTARVAAFVTDCTDPEALAAFWSEILGWNIVFRLGPYVGIGPPAPEWESGWLFQRVDEPKVGKNRCHLDFRVPDLEATRRRVEELGGKRVSGYETGGFLVMADPEENEFCLLPEGVELNMDEHGNVDYLDRI